MKGDIWSVMGVHDVPILLNKTKCAENYKSYLPVQPGLPGFHNLNIYNDFVAETTSAILDNNI